MDNGGEFKGSVLELCKTRNIQPITGRAYYPQTQGSIEQANKTFKNRLRALQMELGIKGWVELLPRIARIINTSTNRALPQGVIPNEVWFGRTDINWPEISERRRKQNTHCTEAVVGAQENSFPSEESEESENDEDETDKEEVHEAMVLSALHQRVKENQDLYNKRMIKNKGGVIIKY